MHQNRWKVDTDEEQKGTWWEGSGSYLEEEEGVRREGRRAGRVEMELGGGVRGRAGPNGEAVGVEGGERRWRMR